MTDKEMIGWLRALRPETDLPATWLDLFDEIARRLEALTRPVGKPPVSPAREAKLREKAKTLCCSHAHEHGDGFRDLLALLDHERTQRVATECLLQDALAEDGRFDAGKAAGVAEALEVVHGLRRRGTTPGSAAALTVAQADTLSAARSLIKGACGPALLPPHQQTHAALVRCREALREIASMDCDAGIAGKTITEAFLGCCQIARETLEEDADEVC